MKNKFFKTIGVAFISFIIVCGILILMHPFGQTGEQWLAEQREYIGDLALLSDDIDTITTLYISGSISENDFLSHINVFEQELKILQTTYQQDMKQTPVKIGTHNYITQSGCEGVENTYSLLLDLMKVMKENSKDTDALSYKYLAYRQKITEELSNYTLADYYINYDKYNIKETENE